MRFRKVVAVIVAGLGLVMFLGVPATAYPKASDETRVAHSPFSVQQPVSALPSDAGDGTYPLNIINNTHGAWADSEVWVFIVGQSSPGQWAYVTAEGAVRPINFAEQTAPGHLEKDGYNYAAMPFQLPISGTITMPASLQGGRVYFSLGAPLYVAIAPDNSGLALPDPSNTADPNYTTIWDHYEFTFVNGQIPFGGNPSQVDQFGFPIQARVQQTSTGVDETTGVTASRDHIRSYFSNNTTGYAGLVNPYRVLAPRTSQLFLSSEASTAMTNYIDETWNTYAKNSFTIIADGQSVVAGVQPDGFLHFTSNGTIDNTITKPRAADVWQCGGALAAGSTIELALEAQLCAAFNRGVAEDPSSWNESPAYYQNPVSNLYADYFHKNSVNNFAYGFPYDDVNDQSSVVILPSSSPPTRITLTIGW